jgi:hypothetical protein
MMTALISLAFSVSFFIYINYLYGKPPLPHRRDTGSVERVHQYSRKRMNSTVYLLFDDAPV